MDPVTAIGVAAAAVQFFQFSLQALNTCREIRDSAHSSTKYNSELEEAVRITSAARKELEAHSKSKTPRRISDIARDCVQLADELTRLLEHVRGANQNNSKAKAIFRAIKDQRKIEKLEQNLRNKQDVLNHALTQDTWIQTRLLVVKQSEGFDKLDQRIQTLVKDLLDENKNISDNLAKLDLNHRTELQSLNENITTKFETIDDKAKARHSQTERDSQHRHDELKLQQQHDRFLNSLFFADIHARRQNISDSAPDTVEWIFCTPSDAADESWDNFVGWLQDTSSSMYWIRGNAGSGKSTLMASILDDDRTSEELKVSSSGRDLHLLSFYFWLPGSELQKSIVGFLRSILFQICQARPSLIDIVLKTTSMNVDRLGSWTEKALTKSIMAALEASAHVSFAIFIDALDECHGDQNTLIDLISRLHQLGNVKCCISSRPEILFVKRLSGCKQLHLEKLNHENIKTFVKSRLVTLELDVDIKEEMEEHIIDNADGVFLWATLVVQDLIDGVVSGDEDPKVLIKRINSLPRELENLFAAMLTKVHPVHQQSLALYISMVDTPFWATQPLDFDIALITATRMIDTLSTQPFSDETFSRLCAQTETQLVAQSAGLLVMDRNWNRARDECKRADHYFVKHRHAGGQVTSAELCRRTSLLDPTFVSIAYYEYRWPRWVHRSAYDFIFRDKSSKLITSWLPSTETLIPQIYKAALWLVSEAPSYAGRDVDPPLAERIITLLAVILMSYETFALQAKSAMKKLKDIIERMDPLEFESASVPVHRYDNAVVRHLPRIQLVHIICRFLIDGDPDLLDIFSDFWDTGLTRLQFCMLGTKQETQPSWQSLGNLCSDTINCIVARYTEPQEYLHDAHETTRLVTFSLPFSASDPGYYDPRLLTTVSFKCPGNPVSREADILEQNEIVAAAMLLAEPSAAWRIDPKTAQRFLEVSEMYHGHSLESRRVSIQLPGASDRSARIENPRLLCLPRRENQMLRKILHDAQSELSFIDARIPYPDPDVDDFEDSAIYEIMDRSIPLKLSDETQATLLNIVKGLLQDTPKRPDIERCRDMIVKDIWANEAGSLSSTEQLLALACVKTGFADLFCFDCVERFLEWYTLISTL